MNFFGGIRDFFVGLADKVGNVVSEIGQGIVYTTQQVLSIFSSVADAVVALKLLPLTGLIGLVLSILITLVGNLLTTLTNCGLKLFSVMSLESGTGNTPFEILYSEFLPSASGIIQLMAFVFLFFVLLFGLVRIMASPDTRDTPFGLILKTIFAGIFIISGKAGLMHFSKIMNLFFQGVIGNVADTELVFDDFTIAVMEAFAAEAESGNFTFTGAQMEAIVCSMLLLFLLILILFQFAKFISEMMMRYLMFHTFIMFFPLACTLAPSKTTSASFGRYINLLLSQGLLLSLNAFVLRIFAIGLTSYGRAWRSMTLQTGSAAPALIFWCFIMFGILVAGSKMDTFMKTLGFSVGEMGSSFTAELMADVQEFARPFSQNGFVMKAANFLSRTASPSSSRADGSPSARGGADFSESSGSGNSVGKAGSIGVKDVDPLTGAVRKDSIRRAMTDGLKTASVRGSAFGKGVINSMHGVPTSVMDTLDPSTASLNNGQLKVSSFASPTGESTTYTFTPLETLNANNAAIPEGARRASIAGVECVATAEGPQAMDFYTSNGAFKHAMEDRGMPGDSFRQVKKPEGMTGRTGIYQQVTEPETEHGARTVTQYTPVGAYESNPIASHYAIHTETIGALAYEVTQAKYAPITPPPRQYMSSYEDFKQSDNAWLHKHFDSLKEIDAYYVDMRGGKFVQYESADSPYRHILAPVLKAQAGEKFSEAIAVNYIKSTNGTDYVDISIPTKASYLDYITPREKGIGFAYEERESFAQTPYYNNNASDILRHSQGKVESAQAYPNPAAPEASPAPPAPSAQPAYHEPSSRTPYNEPQPSHSEPIAGSYGNGATNHSPTEPDITLSETESMSSEINTSPSDEPDELTANNAGAEHESARENRENEKYQVGTSQKMNSPIGQPSEASSFQNHGHETPYSGPAFNEPYDEPDNHESMANDYESYPYDDENEPMDDYQELDHTNQFDEQGRDSMIERNEERSILRNKMTEYEEEVIENAERYEQSTRMGRSGGSSRNMSRARSGTQKSSTEQARGTALAARNQAPKRQRIRARRMGRQTQARKTTHASL